MAKSRLYWQGPEWLSESESTWPCWEATPDEHDKIMQEAKKDSKIMVQMIKEFDLISRFEKYNKIVRIVAHILKWRNLVPRTTNGTLAAQDLTIAELCLLRRSQLLHFAEEYKLLSTNQQINVKSSILLLDPVFDFQKQLIVVGGRLKNTVLPEETKHQIILPCKDRFVEKLIFVIHKLLVCPFTLKIKLELTSASK